MKLSRVERMLNAFSYVSRKAAAANDTEDKYLRVINEGLAEERQEGRAEAREAEWQSCLAMRGIERKEDVCSKCSGLGVALYGSTATWHGGVGGQAITKDVCDKCWGSGNATRPWPSWRRDG